MAWSNKTFDTLWRNGFLKSDGSIQNINFSTMLQAPGNPVVTNDSWFLLDFGTYSNYYSNAYDQLLFESKYAYNGGNRLYFVKSANSDNGSVELRKADNSVVFNFQCVSTAPLLFPRMCGDSGTPPGVSNVQVHLTFNCVQSVIDGTKGCMPSIQALISPVGRVNYPQAAAYAFYCNPGSMNVLGSATQLEQYLDACLNGDYWEEGSSLAPTGTSGGGGGDFYYPDFEIPMSPLPSVSACDTGMCSLYQIDSANIKALGNELWDDQPTGFYETVVKNYNSPFENIISIGIIPAINLNGISTNVKIGNYTSGVPGNKLTTTYYDIDLGIVTIPHYYKTFADYDIILKCFLPYIGLVDIDIQTVIDGKLNIVYRVDVLSGSIAAHLKTFYNGKWRVIAVHNGNFKTEIPISGTNYIGFYSGIIQTMMTGLSGNAVATLASAYNMTGYKPEYLRGGSVGASTGLMSPQYPYLIFQIPEPLVAKNYSQIRGVISNLDVTIGEENGYLQAETDYEILSSIDATDEELNMIKDLLASGIYIS